MAQFPQHQSELLDLSVIIGDAVKMASLVQLYEEYISEEWYEPWDSFIWIAGELWVVQCKKKYQKKNP